MIVRLLEREDIPYLMKISMAELGSDYLDVSDFEDALEGTWSFCYVGEYDGKPSGFIIGNIFGPEMVDEILHMPDGKFRDEALSYSKVGYYASEAIDDSVKGKGLGMKLILKCRERFEESGVEMACAMAWKSVTGKVNIDGILRKIGLEPEVEFLGYWDDPRAFPNGHDCPVCGNPCKCSAVYYIKKYVSP